MSIRDIFQKLKYIYIYKYLKSYILESSYISWSSFPSNCTHNYFLIRDFYNYIFYFFFFLVLATFKRPQQILPRCLFTFASKISCFIYIHLYLFSVNTFHINVFFSLCYKDGIKQQLNFLIFLHINTFLLSKCSADPIF